MRFLGLYMPKLPVIKDKKTCQEITYRQEGDETPNLFELNKNYFLDFSLFTEMSYRFEENNKVPSFRLDGSPLKNAKIDETLKGVEIISAKDRDFSRIFLPKSFYVGGRAYEGMKFDGTSQTKKEFKNRNVFTLGHLARHYVELGDLLKNAEIINMSVVVDTKDRRIPSEADRVFDLLAILPGGRALIKYRYRKAKPTICVDGKWIPTGALGETTDVHYAIWAPLNAEGSHVDMKKYLKQYTTHNSTEMKQRQQELDENMQEIDVKTPKGTFKAPKFKVEFVAQASSHLAPWFRDDYMYRTFSGKNAEPENVTMDKVETYSIGKGGK